MGYIYVIENQINHKKYVGQTTDPYKRWKKHKANDIKNDNLVIGKAFLKYGIENFTFTIIEECDKSLMSEREMYWIKELNTFIGDENSNGYNMTRGGEAMYGDSNPFYGHTHTKEIKKILSESAKNRVGNKNPFFGKHHTQEFKDNRRGSMFFGPNTVKCIAINNKNRIEFSSIRQAYESFKDKVSYDWFRKSVRKSIRNNSIFLDYYWYKGVETIPDECKEVSSEIGTELKCTTPIKGEEIVHTIGNNR